MPPTRKDLLPICNDQGTPLDQFKMMFCDRCVQEECTRSHTGESKFERRVRTWHEDLFSNPKRMDPNDPRFALLSAQKFLTLDVGPIPEVRTSSWMDPRDLETPTVAPVVVSPRVEQKPVPASAPEEVPALPKASPKLPLSVAGMNTPAQKGQMIGGGPTATPPKKDTWAAPAPPQPGDVVVKPGTKVTIGGGSGPSGV